MYKLIVYQLASLPSSLFYIKTVSSITNYISTNRSTPTRSTYNSFYDFHEAIPLPTYSRSIVYPIIPEFRNCLDADHILSGYL